MAASYVQCSSPALSAQRWRGMRPSVAPRSLLLGLPGQRQIREVSCGALAIDWASTQTWAGVGVAMAGIAAGIGIPAFYMSLESQDEQRLEELRELNRQTFKETGEYLSEEELRKIRSPRWTDRRQFEDDD